MKSSSPNVMFIFPGQGSQYRGMGSDIAAAWPAARAVYDRASEVLDLDMAELSFLDPQDQLDQTRFTQPALLTHSLACLAAFDELTHGSVVPAVTAGHSLGEYTALVAAGALEPEAALRAVQERGNLMSRYGRGQMRAFPLAVDSIRPLAERHYCGIGSCNLPEQTVVGGAAEDLELVAAEAKDQFPRGRSMVLRTEGAFHTYLMVEAAEKFREVLKGVAFNEPRAAVIANFTGDYHDLDPESIRSRLFFQMFNPVKWIWGVQRALADDVTLIVEFGGGIGRGDRPDEKRPNLASIMKIAIGAAGRTVTYVPAHNEQSIQKAADVFNRLALLSGYEGEARTPPPHQWHGDKAYGLFLPSREGQLMPGAVEVLQHLGELGLLDAVPTVPEPESSSLSFVQEFIDAEATLPEPYLETIVSRETGAVEYSAGEDLHTALKGLAREMEETPE